MKLSTKRIIYTLSFLLLYLSIAIPSIYIADWLLKGIMLVLSFVVFFLGLSFIIGIAYNTEYECKHCKNCFKLKLGEGYIRLSDDILLLECPKCGKIDWCKHKCKS